MNTCRLSSSTGNIAGIKVVTETDDIMLITSDGTVIRMKTSEVSRIGRLTKGVRLMRLDDDVMVVSMARTEEQEEEEEVTSAEEQETTETVEVVPETQENTEMNAVETKNTEES